jgi:ABC-type uncharacterized transport system YnjBCD ATPase subunit
MSRARLALGRALLAAGAALITDAPSRRITVQ